jgi:hypothetical protein
VLLSIPRTTDQPLQEPDRFFPAPRDHRSSGIDAQSRAVARLIEACARIRPHLDTVHGLDRFVREQRDPARLRRRISLALALEAPQADLVYGHVTLGDLESFRSLARRKPAAVIWVFS